MANKILIIGASKGIGLEAVKQALAAGYAVRALARSATRIPVDHPHLEKVDADALDSSAVQRALDGVDVVIQTLGVALGPQLVMPVHLFSDATRVLVAAMQETGTRRLICVTGFGAGNSRGRGGLLHNAALALLLGRAYDDKSVQEHIVRRSGLDWIIVRPVILTNGPKTGAYQVLTQPQDWRSGFISRADVADFLVKQIDDDRYLRATPVLIG